MQTWDAFVHHLSSALGKAPVQNWLEGVQLAKFDAHNIHLLVRDSFQIHWFCEHIEPLAKTHLRADDRPIRIHLALKNPPLATSSAQGAPSVAPPRTKPGTALALENFQPTEGQRLAHRLITEITAQESSSQSVQLGTFNPIFFYGPTGSGKSQLLASSAARLEAIGKHVIYLDGDVFTEDVVGAIRRGEMQHFRRRYRKADVLIIDSIEKLGKKSATQEEFFHTFNTLHTAGKQIILSAPQPPQALNFIEQRLISRFEWGLCVELTGITTDEAFAILQAKAAKLELSISERDLLCLIAKLDVNLKKLVGALETLAYKSDLQGSYLQRLAKTAEQPPIWESLKDVLQKHQLEKTTPQAVIEQVAAHFGILSTDILGRSQNREFTRPRRLAMYLCRFELRLPFVKIGEIFSRDHSTVMSNCKNIEQSLNLLGAVPDLQEVSQRLRALRV